MIILGFQQVCKVMLVGVLWIAGHTLHVKQVTRQESESDLKVGYLK